MTKLYHHKTDGGAEYLCTSPVEGTDEGDLHTALIRLDGEPALLQRDPNAGRVWVFVSGGLVNDIRADDGTEPDYVVVDYDGIESGECPICRTDLDGDSDTCPNCGLPLDESDYTFENAKAANSRRHKLALEA